MAHGWSQAHHPCKPFPAFPDSFAARGSYVVSSGQWRKYRFHFQKIRLYFGPFHYFKGVDGFEGGVQLGWEAARADGPAVCPWASHWPLGILVFSHRVVGVGWYLRGDLFIHLYRCSAHHLFGSPLSGRYYYLAPLVWDTSRGHACLVGSTPMWQCHTPLPPPLHRAGWGPDLTPA